MGQKLFLGEPLDVTIESQKLLSCVARLQQRKEWFGIHYIVKILCGSCPLEEGHNKLSTYGIGRDEGETFWKILYGILLKNNFVENNYIQIVQGHRLPVLNLNHNSWEILKGNISVVVSGAWRSSLIESKKTKNIKWKVEENGWGSDRKDYYDNQESYVDNDGYGYEFSQQDDSIMDYDSYVEDNSLDYGYLSDMDNYDEY